MVYVLTILLCYLSMIVYREIFSRKPMTVRHAAVPSGVIIISYAAYTLFGRNVFSPWIYPAWFFALLAFVEIYLLLMIPMFFGAVYLGDRRKSWSAMIVPATLAAVVFVWLRGALFYEMGWLVFYAMLLYLVWGVTCALAPRFVWAGYAKLRDKLGGRTLFHIIAGIVSAVFVTVACIAVFTITMNINEAEADYILPQPTTTERG